MRPAEMGMRGGALASVVALWASLGWSCAAGPGRAAEPRRCDEGAWSQALGQPASAEEPVYWSDRPGLLDAPPGELELAEGQIEAEDLGDDLWLGTLRRRGGELFLPGPVDGRRCGAWRLEAEAEDRGWLVFDGGGAVVWAYRYAFRERFTGYVDETDPSRSRSIEQVSLDVEGPWLRRRDAEGRQTVEALLGCSTSYHFVAGDDSRLLIVAAGRPGAVRAYAEAAARPLFLDRAACLGAAGPSASGRK